ncbi:hypothetical protein BDV34DRAFT_193880 [Aspergillus parasiticus]|uniref:Uncharacterized protein n=1 Tax=Aspergillus parasiticus TaxID=5067 RepID=A0A5N6DMZ5_ASPPA|nr:hypothetical protein BDV34DRAFT_193880 [Aspergillus parasiticus]
MPGGTLHLIWIITYRVSQLAFLCWSLVVAISATDYLSATTHAYKDDRPPKDLKPVVIGNSDHLCSFSADCLILFFFLFFPPLSCCPVFCNLS